MESQSLFTCQQVLKLGYIYWLRVKNSNQLLAELSLCYLKHTKVYLEHLLFKQAVLLHLIHFWLPGCGDITLFRTILWLAWSLRSDTNTLSTKLFSKKNHVLLSIFFCSLDMFFIGLFLENTCKKIGGHLTCFLTKSCERWT